MPHTINGLWSTLRSAISDFNPFGQASDFSTFDYLEERVRELEQEVLGLRRELHAPRPGCVDWSHGQSDQSDKTGLHRQPFQPWSRYPHRDDAHQDVHGESLLPKQTELDANAQNEQHYQRTSSFQRFEHAGFVSIEAASPAYEVHWSNLAQPSCC